MIRPTAAETCSVHGQICLQFCIFQNYFYFWFQMKSKIWQEWQIEFPNRIFVFSQNLLDCPQTLTPERKLKNIKISQNRFWNFQQKIYFVIEFFALKLTTQISKQIRKKKNLTTKPITVKSAVMANCNDKNFAKVSSRLLKLIGKGKIVSDEIWIAWRLISNLKCKIFFKFCFIWE